MTNGVTHQAAIHRGDLRWAVDLYRHPRRSPHGEHRRGRRQPGFRAVDPAARAERREPRPAQQLSGCAGQRHGGADGHLHRGRRQRRHRPRRDRHLHPPGRGRRSHAAGHRRRRIPRHVGDTVRSRSGIDGAATTAGRRSGWGRPHQRAGARRARIRAASHPLLAEGARNAFFDVRLALLNVGRRRRGCWLRFLQPGGASLPRSSICCRRAAPHVGRSDFAVLTSPDFSTVVESDQPIVVDRTMTWERRLRLARRDRACRARDDVVSRRGIDVGRLRAVLPAAEPQSTPTTATVRYLLPLGQAPSRGRTRSPPTSRTTIPVDDQGPGSPAPTSPPSSPPPQPIIVERAMYLSRPASPSRPDTGRRASPRRPRAGSWPRARPGRSSTVHPARQSERAAARRSPSTTCSRRHHATRRATVVPANGRFTIWVDDEQIPAGSGRQAARQRRGVEHVTSTNRADHRRADDVVAEPGVDRRLLDRSPQLAGRDGDRHALGAGRRRGRRSRRAPRPTS